VTKTKQTEKKAILGSTFATDAKNNYFLVCKEIDQHDD
jgi:hypothetical protein